MEEISYYERISELLEGISDGRERQKVALLNKLLRKHAVVLAFDHALITLSYLNMLFQQKYGKRSDRNSYVVTGADKTQQKQLTTDFGLRSTAKGIVAFCSDAVSESIDLQRASAIVQLDMPTVNRLAEQRLGRVDRLDSLHERIESHWPLDTGAFSLAADKHLITALKHTHHTIKANIWLPDELIALLAPDSKRPDDWVRERNQESETPEWETLVDALQPVRQLLRGPESLVSSYVYNLFKDITGTVRAQTKPSAVRSETPWAFYVLRGDDQRSGRWFLFTSPNATPETDLGKICAWLRKHLPASESLAWNPDNSYNLLFANRLRRTERERLPPKLARSLAVAEYIVKELLAADTIDNERRELLRRVLLLFIPPPVVTQEVEMDVQIPDYAPIAQQWLDLFAPVVRRKRLAASPREVVTLNVIRTHYKELNVTNEFLENLLSYDPVAPADARLAACILGLPSSE